MRLIPVNPADLDTTRLGRRGRISYPLLKQFLEMNQKLCKIDMTGLDKNPAYLRSVLQSYITSHNLPIKIFSVHGDLHLMKLDEEEVAEIADGGRATEGTGGPLRNEPAVPLTKGEVQKRFRTEKGKVTK